MHGNQHKNIKFSSPGTATTDRHPQNETQREEGDVGFLEFP